MGKAMKIKGLKVPKSEILLRPNFSSGIIQTFFLTDAKLHCNGMYITELAGQLKMLKIEMFKS